MINSYAQQSAANRQASLTKLTKQPSQRPNSSLNKSVQKVVQRGNSRVMQQSVTS